MDYLQFLQDTSSTGFNIVAIVSSCLTHVSAFFTLFYFQGLILKDNLPPVRLRQLTQVGPRDVIHLKFGLSTSGRSCDVVMDGVWLCWCSLGCGVFAVAIGSDVFGLCLALPWCWGLKTGVLFVFYLSGYVNLALRTWTVEVET